MPTDLGNWLQRQGLAHLESVLFDAGVDLDVLGDLSEADLTGLGLSLGDRKRLLKAVATSPPGASSAPHQGAAPSVGPGGTSDAPAQLTHPDAQRRQVTVMFCDLVGSTSLSTQMDPEDLRELIARYHQHASREIKAAGGFVAKFMGDGVLAYFGYPQASENDAERAVRAGLAVVQGMQAVNLRGRGDLQVRVGIATGTVVVGDLVVEGTAPERAVVGETPNLAARLQSLAEPGQVLIGASTRRLLGELFELQDLGALAVKGFSEPVQAWQVLGQRAAASRFEAQRAGALSRFVGRDSEVAMLLERWELAADGEGQVVLVTGEAGIGKSRITAALRERVGQQQVHSPALMLLWQCSPLHSGTPLYPVVQQLQQAVQIEPGLETRLSQAGVPEATRGWVLRLAGAAAQQPTGLDPSVEKTNTLYAVVEALQALSARQPVLLLLEDAHWIDPSTEELLALAVQQLRAHRVLLVVTSRPGYEPGWQQAPNLTRLALSRLAQRQSLQLAQEVASEVARSVMGQWSLPRELLEQIVKRTDGVPLFVEELTKAVLEAGLPQELQQGWQGEGIAKLAIPTTLQDSLTARLDRLQPGTREVAQAASVIGREFSQALLREALKPMGEAQVVQALQELQRAELVYLRQGAQPVAGGGTGHASGAGNTAPTGAGGTGSFKHALVRDAAYGSLLKAQRAQWHAKVARALEAVQPQVVQQQPELLAGHRQQAGELAAALELWRKAGDLAFSRSSLVEAAEHYRAAAALCTQMPVGHHVEFPLQMKRSAVLTQAQGYGSQEGLEASRRAFMLSEHPGLAGQRLDAASALGSVLVAMGRGSEAERLVHDLERESLPEPTPRQKAFRLYILGTSAQIAGRLLEARTHLGLAIQAIALDQEGMAGELLSGMHPKSWILSFLARNMMYAGLLDQGRELTDQMMTEARSSGHPPTIASAMIERINWLLLMDRVAEADAMNREVLMLADRHRAKPQGGAARMLLGRTLMASGEAKQGAALIREGMELWMEGLSSHITIMAAGPARAMAAVGDLEGVKYYLDIGDRALRETDERLGEAELLRTKAWLMRKLGDREGAGTCLQRAMAVAGQQGAGFFELRAAMDWVKLSEGTEHEPEAVAALQRIYSSFTEGFGYSVLKSARKVLEAKGSAQPIATPARPPAG